MSPDYTIQLQVQSYLFLLDRFFLISIIKVSFIFGILAYSQSDIKYAAQREFYYRLFIEYSIIPLR